MDWRKAKKPNAPSGGPEPAEPSPPRAHGVPPGFGSTRRAGGGWQGSRLALGAGPPTSTPSGPSSFVSLDWIPTAVTASGLGPAGF
jgi:hypothetical protein